MKNHIKLLLTFYMLVFMLFGCAEVMDEDQKIKNAFIGRFYEDDEELEDGSVLKDMSSNYYEDGSFISKVTFVLEEEDSFEQTEILFYFEGKWEIRNKFIYYTYDFNRFRVTPSSYSYMLDAMKEKIQKHNSPDEIISYNEAKIVYQNVDGKIYTLKKTN